MVRRDLVVVGNDCSNRNAGGVVFDVGQVNGLRLLGHFQGNATVARRMVVRSRGWWSSLSCRYVPGVCTGVDDGRFVDGKVRCGVILWMVRDLRTAGVVSVVVDLGGSLGGLRLSLLTGCRLEVLVDGELFV